MFKGGWQKLGKKTFSVLMFQVVIIHEKKPRYDEMIAKLSASYIYSLAHQKRVKDRCFQKCCVRYGFFHQRYECHGYGFVTSVCT